MRSPSNSSALLIRDSLIGRRVLIVTHKDPDPDAIGSCLAMAHMLSHYGAKDVAVWSEAVSPNLFPLPGMGQIYAQKPEGNWEVLLALDAANRERIPAGEKGLGNYPCEINIDHHADNTCFGHLNLVWDTASSVGEMLSLLFQEWEWPILPDAATNLYAAIAFDTGRFLFQNTTASTFKMAAHLMESGADVRMVSLEMFQSLSPQSFEVMKAALDRLNVLADLRFAYCVLPKSVPEAEIKVVDFIRQMAGIDVVAVFTETAQEVKVNLRSKTEFEVHRIAHQFGGGGHRQAAGITLQLPLEEAVEQVVTAVKTAIRSA